MADAGGGDRVSIARRGLLIYGLVLIVLSAACQGALIVRGKPINEEQSLILLLMWTPAVASVVARLFLREGFRDVSFRLRPRVAWRSLLLAWLHPLGVGAVAYGAAWTAGLAS